MALSADAILLFATRIIRLFAYGFLAVVLVLYLASLGLDDGKIGALLTLTLIGDVALSLLLTTKADIIGRKRTLLAGAVLMVVAAIVFALTRDFTLLVIAATIGVISPSGNEVGPFLAIEQVAIAQATTGRDRTALFAWYNLAGSFATALGSLAGGFFTEAASYRAAIFGYATLGAVLAIAFAFLSPRIESTTTRSPEHVERSRGVVAKLSALFALDSFAGGLVVQSVVAYWFHQKFGLSPAALGSIFFGANLLAGVSALAAAWMARRIGLLNTMVFTHLPSNVLLILVPFMPTLPLAIAVLLLRFSISQMDVPTRQAFVIAAVHESERTAAAGITGVARTTGAALAPVLAVPLIASLYHSWIPFVAAGALKIAYDLMLLRAGRRMGAID
ncbi:MAG TPA: MFS transporter [Thermoanaerobaculia bacterium]